MRSPCPPMRLQPAGCCRTVDLSGVPGAQSSREGTFSQVVGVVGQGGRPVYQNELNNQFLYFWAEYLAWRIGPDFESAIAGVISAEDEDTRCANEATGWHATSTHLSPQSLRKIASVLIRALLHEISAAGPPRTVLPMATSTTENNDNSKRNGILATLWTGTNLLEHNCCW